MELLENQLIIILKTEKNLQLTLPLKNQEEMNQNKKQTSKLHLEIKENHLNQ